MSHHVTVAEIALTNLIGFTLAKLANVVIRLITRSYGNVKRVATMSLVLEVTMLTTQINVSGPRKIVGEVLPVLARHRGNLGAKHREISQPIFPQPQAARR